MQNCLHSLGHGPLVEDAGLKISEYIQHREKREKQILDAIQKAGQQGLDAMSITRAIYPVFINKNFLE